jgi:hypothetical protein
MKRTFVSARLVIGANAAKSISAKPVTAVIIGFINMLTFRLSRFMLTIVICKYLASRKKIIAKGVV